MTTARLTIRYGTVRGRRCYRWNCEDCGVGGAHRFDRWTDHVRARHPDAHPWRRCLAAVDTHVCERHQDLIHHRTTDSGLGPES